MGAGEIFFIALVVIMFFGTDKIPEIARTLGKGMRQIKDATNDIKREINQSAAKSGVDLDITKDIREVVNDVKKSVDLDVTSELKTKVNDIVEPLDDLTGPIKRNM